MKDKILDKKLLGNILDKKVLTIKSLTKTKVHFKYENGGVSTETVMSLHDLANKCKERLILDGYGLSSYPVKTYTERSIAKWVCQVLYFGQEAFFMEDISEPDVIFKTAKTIFAKKS